MKQIVLLISFALACAAEGGFPAGLPLTDIRACGAVGDGIADDTAAFQKALERTGLIYVPDGTYLVRDELKPPPRPNSAPARRVIQGQSRERTIIRLADACPGFTDGEKPKPVLRTSWGVAQAFRNGVRDLTIDVGRGNPGADAIAFFASNTGGMHRVTLRAGEGSGNRAIDLGGGDNGPLLVNDVACHGFRIGVQAPNGQGFALCGLRLTGMRGIGLDVANSIVSLHGLDYEGSGPAIRTSDAGVLAAIDVTVRGAGAAAVEDRGGTLIRRLRQQGFAAAIVRQGWTHAAAEVAEYHSRPALAAGFPVARLGLDLPIRPTPSVPWDEPSRWTSLAGFEDKAVDGDWSPALQAAIDGGATTVFLHRGDLSFRGEVVLRGRLRRLFGSELAPAKAPKDGQGATFVVADGEAPTVVIERFDSTYSRLNLQHRSTRTLVASSLLWHRVEKAAGSGDLFLEDVYVQDLRIGGGDVWARGFNTEYGGEGARVENRGRNLWLFGFKNEGDGVKLLTGAGAASEFFGYVLANKDTPSLQKPPLFVVEDGGRLSATLGENVGRKQPHGIILRETRAGETRELGMAGTPRRGANGLSAAMLLAGAPDARPDSPLLPGR